MMNREDIIGGLQFTAGMVTFNPLNGETITPEELNEQDKLTYDACMGAIDLLKAQEPRVMTLEEVSTLPIDTPVFIEEINDECGWNVFYGIDEEKDVCFCGFKASADYYDLEEYGMSWRCWSSRPTDEQREETKWDDE